MGRTAFIAASRPSVGCGQSAHHPVHWRGGDCGWFARYVSRPEFKRCGGIGWVTHGSSIAASNGSHPECSATVAKQKGARQIGSWRAYVRCARGGITAGCRSSIRAISASATWKAMTDRTVCSLCRANTPQALPQSTGCTSRRIRSANGFR